jgi:hypothetical protein
MSTQPPALQIFHEEGEHMDYTKFLQDFFKLVTTTDPVDSLKMQIKWYDDMLLANVQSYEDMAKRRDDLINTLLQLEASEHTEATETSTVAE